MKKILGILLMGVLVVNLTGCGTTQTPNEKENSSDDYNEQEDNLSKMIKQTYYCNNTYDDDTEYYLYYENNKLVRMTETSIYGDNEDYKEAQEEIKGIKGLSVTRKNNKLYIDYNMEYVDSFADKQTYFDFSNTSYESMNSQLKSKGFSCSLIEE